MKRLSNSIGGILLAPLSVGERFFHNIVAPLLTILAILYSFGNLTLILSQRPPFMIPLNKISSPHYGPFPSIKSHPKNQYHFNATPSGMGNFPLWRIEEIPAQRFHAMMTDGIPPGLHQPFLEYLSMGLKNAEKYQVDPFWVMAVMWVESHFNPDAKSRVNAMGLMQILPGTGHFIHGLMGRPLTPELSNIFVREPHHNVEMGVFYLKRMLARFKGNHTLATVAYNMGPTRVQKRLLYRLPVGVDNRYLDKVRKAYRRLSRSYRLYLTKNPPLYTRTYASHPQYRKKLSRNKKKLFWFLPSPKKQTAAYALKTHRADYLLKVILKKTI